MSYMRRENGYQGGWTRTNQVELEGQGVWHFCQVNLRAWKLVKWEGKYVLSDMLGKIQLLIDMACCIDGDLK